MYPLIAVLRFRVHLLSCCDSARVCCFSESELLTRVVDVLSLIRLMNVMISATGTDFGVIANLKPWLNAFLSKSLKGLLDMLTTHLSILRNKNVTLVKIV